MPFNRLSISLLVVVVVGVLGLGFLLSELYSSLEHETEVPEYQAVKVLGGQMAQTLGAANDLPAAFQQLESSTGFNLSLISHDELPLPESLAQSLYAGEALLLQSEVGNSSLALSAYLAIPNSKQLLVIGGLPGEEAQQSHGTRLALTLAFYAGLLGVVLLWLAPLLRRLNSLRKVTRAFGQGDLQQRVHSSGASYIAAIEADFNQMADKIQELMADNRLLSRAVSHDLKTPLARLRFGVEMLGQSQDAEMRKKYSERVEVDLDEMESLVTTLLDYARMEDIRPSLQLESIDLNSFVLDLSNNAVFDHSVNLKPSSHQSTRVKGDARYLTMLLLNLLNNACAHARSRVDLSLELVDGKCVLCVEDDGDGIPESERDRVLKPFVRLDSGREDSIKGHGMGLAIVLRLANWHDARLVLEDSKTLGGARVELHFPLSRSSTFGKDC